MLSLLQIKNPEDRDLLFLEQDWNDLTWVVSDLKSKFEIQKQLINKFNYFQDQSVLRASELWKIILKSSRPDFKFVSNDYLKIFIKPHFDEISERYLLSASAFDTVIYYCNYFLPIHTHPRAIELMRDWFTQNPKSYERWGKWFEISYECVCYCVDSKVITSKWASCLLQNENQIRGLLSKNIIFDLGPELSYVEAEIIKRISHQNNVSIVAHNDENLLKKYAYLLKPYQYLENLSDNKKIIDTLKVLDIETAQSKNLVFKKYSGSLAEIKHAVSQIRAWLEGGIRSEHIVVAAPDIEIYWPVLRRFLDIEGVPYNKDVTVKYQSMSFISSWLSELRTVLANISSEDLELCLFSSIDDEKFAYDRFKSLFTAVYDINDLDRDLNISKYFNTEIRPHSKLSPDEFVVFALSRYRFDGSDEIVINLLRELLRDSLSNQKIRSAEWLGYLESLASSREQVIVRGDQLGINCVSLMSLDSSSFTHKIILGLTESAIKPTSKSQLESEEIFNISQNLGFFIENPDQNFLEYQLDWQQKRTKAISQFCYSATNFEGVIQNPSLFWLKNSNSTNHSIPCDLPELTRWDFIQKNEFHESSYKVNEVDRLELLKAPRLSASSLEEYAACPFKFLASRLFKLYDPEIVDIDLDSRSKGTFLHSLTEELVKHINTTNSFEISTETIERIINQIVQDRKMVIADKNIWAQQLKKYIDFSFKFLEKEKIWKAQFEKLSIISGEVEIEFYFDLESKNFIRKSQLQEINEKKYIQFKGKIDRLEIDRDGHSVVVDYKSSTANKKQVHSWLANRDLQLLFYAWVLDKDFIATEMNQECIGAFYYSLKTLKRNIGFRLNGFDDLLYSSSDKSRNKIDLDEKNKLYADFEEVLKTSIDNILKGDFQPRPFDKNICDQCNWSNTCRAPHLN